MTRRDEVEAKIEAVDWANDWEGDALALRGICRTLADEVDAEREIVTKLLAMLKPDKHRPSWEHDEYARACEIAGRTD